MVDRPELHAALLELILALDSGDRAHVLDRWRDLFGSEPPSESEGWPWQSHPTVVAMRALFEVTVCAVSLRFGGRWPDDEEIAGLVREQPLRPWRRLRTTGHLLAAVAPGWRYRPRRILAVQARMSRDLLHEVVGRPSAAPQREPFPLVMGVAALLTAGLLAYQPGGVAAGFDRAVGGADESWGHDRRADAVRVFYRMFPAFTRVQATRAQLDALRSLVVAAAGRDVAALKSAFADLRRLVGPEEKQRLQRVLMDGAMRMFSTDDGRPPTRARIAELVEHARARARQDDAAEADRLFDDDAAVAACVLLEVCAGLRPKVGPTNSNAAALAFSTALEVIAASDDAGQRLDQIEWLFCDVATS